MNPNLRSTLRVACLIAGISALAACALAQRDADAGAPASTAAGARSVEAIDASKQGEPRYIRYRADETGLISAIDDGANTYLELDPAADPALAINDQDGRALVWTRVGQVIAIAGLHQGVLLRQGERASFFSPNPRWQGRVAMTLPARADYAEARARLENQAMLQSAMERALVASSSRAGGAEPASDTRPAFSASSSSSHGTSPGASSGNSPGASPVAAIGRGTDASTLTAAVRANPPASAAASINLQPGIQRSASATLAPLTMANLSASAAEQGLIRVFFASASRSIVAPDDGLATLLREAPQADEIRITGFTDAIGSKDANLRLARSRADAVAQILYRRGVASPRVVIDAVAGEEFLAGNDTDKGRALNRRAEIVLIKGGRPMLLGSASR